MLSYNCSMQPYDSAEMKPWPCSRYKDVNFATLSKRKRCNFVPCLRMYRALPHSKQQWYIVTLQELIQDRALKVDNTSVSDQATVRITTRSCYFTYRPQKLQDTHIWPRTTHPQIPVAEERMCEAARNLVWKRFQMCSYSLVMACSQLNDSNLYTK